ncbi:Potential post-segregation antitoxin similar to CcdA [Aromatoleum aromaticum EbN1]|uniref:Potential post-segregation antitoxin similar to CcdA n=2 Tax=Aromatoleum aromaticum TaxID=551760 RepID=Q5P2R6_AROAE|nr:Potential post-segregation antitoxin similar to CcdA [Aromatoleum aromaticum EbN1]
MRIGDAQFTWRFEMRTHAVSSKKATNLSLSADVLAEAKSLGINISKACDECLRELVRRERARRWKEEYAEFIEVYNRIVEAEGVPLAEWRSF